MKNNVAVEKQIQYLRSQIDDINFKVEQADKGFEVGDITKLEAQKEILENKLRKLITENYEDLSKATFEGIKIVQVDEEKEDKNGLADKVAEVVNNDNKKTTKKSKIPSKTKSILIKLLIGLALIAFGISMGAIEAAEEVKEVKAENEAIKKCYNKLLDEDFIEEGCEKYFKNDRWYKDYLKVVELDKLNK